MAKKSKSKIAKPVKPYIAVEHSDAWATNTIKTPGEAIAQPGQPVATPGQPVDAELLDGAPAFLAPREPLSPPRTFDFSSNPTVETQDQAVMRELASRQYVELSGQQSWASSVVLGSRQSLKGRGRSTDIIAPGKIAVQVGTSTNDAVYHITLEDLNIDNCDTAVQFNRCGGTISLDKLRARANLAGMSIFGIGERSRFHDFELRECDIGLDVTYYGGYGLFFERFNLVGCRRYGLRVFLHTLPYRLINAVWRNGEIQGNGGSKYPEAHLYGNLQSCGFENVYAESTGDAPKFAGQVAIGGSGIRDMRWNWQCQLNCKPEWTPAMVIDRDVPDYQVKFDGKMRNTRRTNQLGFVVCERSSKQFVGRDMMQQPTVYAPDLDNWPVWLAAKAAAGPT